MSSHHITAVGVLVLVGFFAACLPKFLVPTDHYFNQQLQLVNDDIYNSYTGYSDFYFTYQPSDLYITPDDNSSNIFLYSTVFSNSSSLNFSLETCTSSSNFFGFMYSSSSSGVCRFIVNKSILTDNQRVLFRISCSDGDRTIYSNPFVIYSSGYYPVKSDEKKSDVIDSEVIDDEKTENY